MRERRRKRGGAGRGGGGGWEMAFFLRARRTMEEGNERGRKAAADRQRERETDVMV